jgi:hypothetical protein
LFHRWLPDGEKDAIFLETNDTDTELKVWFEKEGFASRTFMIPGESQDNDYVISEQGKLDAGSLRGLLTIKNLSQEELDTLSDNKIGNDIYIKLGKRVIKKLIYKPVNNFLKILRIIYGQYWIKEMREWDSRNIGLGHYCTLIYLKWSLDGGQKWFDFIPEKGLAMSLTLTLGRDYLEYLTQTDWKKLEELAKNYSPSLAATILSRSHQLLDQGDIRYALLEAVTAFELSINDYLRNKLSGYAELDSFINHFNNITTNPDKMKIFSAFLSNEISLCTLKECLKAIEWRNKIIHEGKMLPDNFESAIITLQKTVGKLLLGPRQRFPSASKSNSRMTKEEWDKFYPSLSPPLRLSTNPPPPPLYSLSLHPPRQGNKQTDEQTDKRMIDRYASES